MKYLLSILLFTLTIQTIAQKQLLRWEIQKKVMENDFNVVSAEENGLVVFRETDKYEEGDKIWQFKFLSTDLEVTHEFEINLDHELNLAGYDYQSGYFYLLFKDGMMNDSDWYLYQMDFTTGEHVEYMWQNQLEIELSHFLVSGDYMVLGGRVDNKPAIVHFSMANRKMSVIPGFYRNETELMEMKRNQNGTFNVLFLDRETNRDTNVLWLKVYSDTGELLLESSTTFDEEVRIHSGTTNELEGSELVIVGTYGERKSKLSSGMYFINVRPGNKNTARFTDFTEMKNFFKHLGENREERIMEKISEASDDKPYEFRTTLMLWKVEEHNGKYFVFAELVDPNYQTGNRRRYYDPYTAYGSPFYDDYFFNNSFNRRYYSNSHSLLNKDIMVSVDYEQNVMAVFDRQGKLLYDVSQVIDDIETPILEQVSAYDYFDGKYQLMYKKEGELYFAKGEGVGNIQADSLVNIDTLDPMIQVKNDNDRDGGVEHWYNNYYFVWGYQRVQDAVENERKTVFYINKIEM